ncbi:uncharacterized protein LOC132945655 [Metopolophium dirhodum]|uniref:uncharacterized protein LOC132945655 n=1 Tax=Metopolophium dirhodum TaxID=44670 RepID=UPI00298FFF89|nr:uncharacterized protein LOC132945655 [Metopolophium dirhodum]
MPRQPLSRSIADKYQHLALADPSFINPGTIDVLLGADLFAQILNGKRVSVGDAFPTAFGTVFGWTIIGPVSNSTSNISESCHTSLTTSVETLLEKFWALEEPDAAPEQFTQEGQCEAIFRDGCTRDSSGRFCVPLLLRQAVSGDTFRGSRAVAEKRFEHLEKKLANNPRLRHLYCDFMSEYLKLGHMSPAKSDGDYFIPHHAVYRPTNTNPKIRVVVDASATSYSGFSLNDCLLPGPKLQRDVVDVLLLYRVHRFAFTTDISKMYRQVSVSPSHRRYQHILWRSSPEQMLQAYELNTVTYGVNCAPYLAIKVLRSMAEQDCNDLPFIKEALLYQTYVDDICAGGDTLDEALSLQDGLIQVLHGAGMELKKWAGNAPVLLDKIPSEDRTCEPLSLDDSTGTGTKVLGLQWSHQDDAFMYTFQPERHVSTKRGMLSLIARMFDPLGLLSPVTFFAKTLMQRVWKAGLSWDEQLPLDIAEVWRSFVADLSNLQCVRIPRFLGTRRDMQCSICGFCDASSTGYAAVVYLRVIDSSGNPSVSLLGARSKIAPVKSTTIPRAPHFGGLWEAAVRSSKSLLMRIMREHTLTIEEFGTVLCRCEAILNSRPITPAPSNPAELECLTPGHFLIGKPLLAVPVTAIPSTTRLLEQRWKLVSQCVQAFWRRWRNKYLQTLQIRSRWTNDSPNISVDDMVVIKDAHTPPLKWRMGRVIEVLAGSDNVVRVVRLRTATGILTRPVVKVVKLIN